MKKKCFFACSMRGGFPYVSQEFLRQIPDALEEIGLELMSKHQTQEGILEQEAKKGNVSVHDRDYGWLEGCDFVVAEISNPSDGVGAEVADAVNLGRPVLALYQRRVNEMSMYIKGKIEKYEGRHAQYKDLDDLKRIVEEFVDSI